MSKAVAKQKRREVVVKPVRIGKLVIGGVPRVVGSLTTAAEVEDLAFLKQPVMDIVEIRLDQVGATMTDWLGACRRIERAGIPVLLTIRLIHEGGHWAGSEAEREALYRRALPHISAIDVEIRSAIIKPLAAEARRRGKTLVGSYHEFLGTSPAAVLADYVRQGRQAGAGIVKIATFINRPPDVIELFDILRLADRGPVCLIGMGALGAQSRLSLACAGSCLTYGYIDRPAAPGQMSCRQLARQLAEYCPGYTGPVHARR